MTLLFLKSNRENQLRVTARYAIVGEDECGKGGISRVYKGKSFKDSVGEMSGGRIVKNTNWPMYFHDDYVRSRYNGI